MRGVQVGHTTIREGDNIRTGVTAILPHGGNLFQDKVAGAVFVGNAFGKLAGSTGVAEVFRLKAEATGAEIFRLKAEATGDAARTRVAPA